MPFGADHMQATAWRTQLSSCFTTRRIHPSPGRSPRATPESGDPRWGFLRSSGDALLQLNHREGTFAPGLDESAPTGRGLVGVVGEDRDKGSHRCGAAWLHSISEPSWVALRCKGCGGLWSSSGFDGPAAPPQLQAGHVVAVAAENDVSATARHVGGDGRRQPGRLGHVSDSRSTFSGLALSRLSGSPAPPAAASAVRFSPPRWCPRAPAVRSCRSLLFRWRRRAIWQPRFCKPDRPVLTSPDSVGGHDGGFELVGLLNSTSSV